MRATGILAPMEDVNQPSLELDEYVWLCKRLGFEEGGMPASWPKKQLLTKSLREAFAAEFPRSAVLLPEQQVRRDRLLNAAVESHKCVQSGSVCMCAYLCLYACDFRACICVFVCHARACMRARANAKRKSATHPL
jgi:hypothetical protein